MKSINILWVKDEIRAGKDWFSDFLKRKGDIAMKKARMFIKSKSTETE